MYTDDDEIGRAVAADLEECWQGEGWYRICFTDGMGSYPATWYGTEADLADDLRGAYGDAGEIHLPYAEISVIDQAVEKVWQGEGWYRAATARNGSRTSTLHANAWSPHCATPTTRHPSAAPYASHV